MPFILGIASGVIVAVLIHRMLLASRKAAAEEEVAPRLVSLELARAKRIGYGLALALFSPGPGDREDLYRWLAGRGHSLKLRDYDIILHWPGRELLILLPGADVNSRGPLRERIEGLLLEGGWEHISFGIVLFPEDSDELEALLQLARNRQAVRRG